MAGMADMDMPGMGRLAIVSSPWDPLDVKNLPGVMPVEVNGEEMLMTEATSI